MAVVDEPQLTLLREVESVYALARQAVREQQSLTELIESRTSDERVDYDAIYTGASDWTLLAPVDHPAEPARCLVSGTGLTHLGSALNRGSMHSRSEADLTDSIRMFRAGMEGGRPAPGRVGTAPEWFYKGSGHILKGPGEPLVVPAYAEDGGEEAEVAGIYLVDQDGQPHRIGMAQGNEFSDHNFEQRNYLNLAGSKLRMCSIGPEIAIDPEFESVAGTVSIERRGKAIWTRKIATGTEEMCHSLINLEHHHFKFEAHRRPGDLHVHFYGAHSLSFGDGVRLLDRDVMVIQFDGFGRALRNPVSVVEPADELVTVVPLT